MYKTGDRHPEHNQLAFVRYDEQGREEWTSIFRDPTAPHRLARESELAALERKCSTDRSDCSGLPSGSRASMRSSGLGTSYLLTTILLWQLKHSTP